MAATVTMLTSLHHNQLLGDMHSATTLRITGEHKPALLKTMKHEPDCDTMLDNDRIDYNDVFMVSESLAAAAAAAATTTSSGTVPTTAHTTMTTAPPLQTTVTAAPQLKTGIKRSRSTSSTGDSTPELLRCKRRINFAQLGYSLPPAAPTSVARRNERERNRVKLVNLGFATLREHVPNGAKNKKMSKVETLRSAVEYIRKLQELLIKDGATTADIENALLTFGSSFDMESSMDGASDDGSGSSSQAENIAPDTGVHHLHHHDLQSLQHHHLHQEEAASPESASSPPHHNHHHHHLVHQQQQLQQQLQQHPQQQQLHQRFPSLSTVTAVTTATPTITPMHHIRNNGHATTTTLTTPAGQLVSSHPPSSVSPPCSVASSPTPSYTSDYSSYEPLSPEDEDLLDFTSWFS